jgi:hypothetical protein
LTVITGFVYVPAVTPVAFKAMVPVVVIGPPDSPVPVLIVVTVPPAEVLEIMTVPVPAEREMPEPAMTSSTPELTMVIAPVAADTAIPGPGVRLVTPDPPPPVALMTPVT